MYSLFYHFLQFAVIKVNENIKIDNSLIFLWLSEVRKMTTHIFTPLRSTTQ